jgi:hypothetical protein
MLERKTLVKSFKNDLKVMGNEGRIRHTFPILRIIMRKKG